MNTLERFLLTILFQKLFDLWTPYFHENFHSEKGLTVWNDNGISFPIWLESKYINKGGTK